MTSVMGGCHEADSYRLPNRIGASDPSMTGIRKGRVREEILSLLSHQPKSMTQLSSELGIAKSTASYHLASLLDDGLVKVASLTPVRGRAMIKKYFISRPAYKVVEAETLRRLFQRVETERLNFSGSPDDLKSFLIILLFHSYRYLCELAGMDHGRIMNRVGETVGRNEVSMLMDGKSLRSVIGSFLNLLSKNSISSGMAYYTRTGASLTFADFLDSQHFDERISCFIEGILSGVITSRFGLRYSISSVRPGESLGLYNFSLYRGRKRQPAVKSSFGPYPG